MNVSPKKNGNTAKLINALREGADGAGHEVREFYLQGMNIHGCLDCQGCRNAKEEADNPCVQKDGMAEIYGAFPSSDVLVFASPVYFWTIDGQLKTAIDRLYAYVMWGRAGKKETALLLTAGGDDERQYAKILDWYGGAGQNRTFHHEPDRPQVNPDIARLLPARGRYRGKRR